MKTETWPGAREAAAGLSSRTSARAVPVKAAAATTASTLASPLRIRSNHSDRRPNRRRIVGVAVGDPPIERTCREASLADRSSSAMPSLEAKRTLVKSPPEIWAEVSDAGALARHLGEFGEIRITRTQPESVVEWEGDLASGCVRLEPSGWGTKVTLTAEAADPPAPEPEPEPEPEPDPAPAGQAVVLEPLPAPARGARRRGARSSPAAQPRRLPAGARARPGARGGGPHQRARHARCGASQPVQPALSRCHNRSACRPPRSAAS